MSNPKLRRVFALTALIFALSLLPAQAAGFASRQPRGVSFAQRFEHWGTSAWSFLAGLFEKGRSHSNPDGAPLSSDGGE